jgi:hypothetical protein
MELLIGILQYSRTLFSVLKVVSERAAVKKICPQKVQNDQSRYEMIKPEDWLR